MPVGLELARLVMEQSVATQAEQMPASALAVAGDQVRLAGTERGAEALLQLTSDLLSTSQPLTEFWHTRPHRQTGCRTYSKHAL